MIFVFLFVGGEPDLVVVLGQGAQEFEAGVGEISGHRKAITKITNNSRVGATQSRE
jgi:hypothetical protein